MRQLKVVPMITRRKESLSVESYLSEVSKIPLITAQDEVNLSYKIRQNGDEKAMQALVNANLRFVISVAKQYQDQGLGLMDIINEGNIGLIKAAEKFDATKGFKFITYAVWWIRQSILQALAENSRIVRLPLNQLGKISKVRGLINELEQKENRPVTPEELANADFSAEDISELMDMNRKPIMLDAFIGDDEDTRVGSIIIDENSPSPDESSTKESLKINIERLFKVLTEKERIVIEMYYGIGQRERTLPEIGDYLNQTPERIRQIKVGALRRLKASNGAKLLEN